MRRDEKSHWKRTIPELCPFLLRHVYRRRSPDPAKVAKSTMQRNTWAGQSVTQTEPLNGTQKSNLPAKKRHVHPKGTVKTCVHQLPQMICDPTICWTWTAHASKGWLWCQILMLSHRVYRNETNKHDQTWRAHVTLEAKSGSLPFFVASNISESSI